MHKTFKRRLLSHAHGTLRLLKLCRMYKTFCNAETNNTKNIYRHVVCVTFFAAGNDFRLFSYARRYCIDVSELIMLCSAALFVFNFFSGRKQTAFTLDRPWECWNVMLVSCN